jgi:protein SCO1/2
VTRFTHFVALALILTIAAACRQQEPAKEYPLKGQIVGINRETRQLTVKHEDIAGLMPGMIMSFDVADPAEIDRRSVGELMTATLVVQDFTSKLKDIRVTGRAPVERAVERSATTAVLQEGDRVPDAALVDQDGRTRRLSEWRGSVAVLTFIYTRCPLPEFCPRMERNFLALQKTLRQEGMTERAALLAVSFDPKYDTPDVLKKHATAIGADESLWRFFTGEIEALEGFAAQFGVSIIRNPSDERDITHNLRTAVIAPDGTIAAMFSGNGWTPAEALEAVKKVDPGRR